MIKRGDSKGYGSLILFVLIVFLVSAFSVGFAVADNTNDGRSGAGIPGDSNETKPKYKDTPPADTSTPCVDESLLKKLDKSLQSIAIFDSMDESFTGFYIRLKEKDTFCEFKLILEQKNLKITHSPEKNLVYLAFTYENVIDKMNEVKSLPFVAYVYSDLVKVPATNLEKLQIFINLNRADNVSRTTEIRGGKKMSVYMGPGELGKVLEQAGVELKNYYEDLKAYYALATSEVIRKVAGFSPVIFIEQEGGGSEASSSLNYSLLNDATFFSENLTGPANKSVQLIKEEGIVKEKADRTPVVLEQQKDNWFSKLISGIIGFFKSIFGD